MAAGWRANAGLNEGAVGLVVVLDDVREGGQGSNLWLDGCTEQVEGKLLSRTGVCCMVAALDE